MSRLKLTSDNYEKSEDFTVEYSPPLKIKKLALESFSIKKTWHNISEKFNNNKFKLIEGNNERSIKIPNGSYTVKSLNRYMIELFGIDSPIKFGIIEERELISVNLKKNFKMDLTEGNLHQLLGFKAKILDQENQIGEYIADITHGIDNIYIHCDIVKGSLINNCDSDVIHSFVSKIPHGGNITKDFNNWIFSSVEKKNIYRIRMRITNQNNELIDLNKGRVEYNFVAVYDEEEEGNYLKKIYNLMEKLTDRLSS